MAQNIIYHISVEKDYTDINEAEKMLTILDNHFPTYPQTTITYYMPQPEYKSWVPNWVIRLITKNK